MKTLPISVAITLMSIILGFFSIATSQRKLKLIPQRVKGAVRFFSLLAFFILSALYSYSQNYTSAASGSWTTGSNWVGGTAPAVANQSWGTINVNHNLTITGTYDFRGGTLNIAAGKTLTITSDFSISNGPDVNVSGTLLIGGNVSLNANLNVLPGGKVIVDGNVSVYSSTYLNVGTNVNPPSYADMVIKGNLYLNGGKATIEKNARFAVFGSVISNTNGGSKLTIKSGGQVYVDQNITLNGGGDQVTNANGSSPIGFYLNGTATTTAGGASVTTNNGSKATMQTNDPAFYAWVQSQPNSPLPITLITFKANAGNNVVSLTWSTSSEENFDKFVIQRSLDGKTFDAIGEVNGAGNSKTLLNYSFEDAGALIGKNYYRLKSVDLDGKFEYSGVISATLDVSKEIVMYPNPSNGESVSFKSNFEAQEDDAISIMDLSGIEVFRASVSSHGGAFAFNTTLKPGTYLVKYLSADFTKVERLVVR